MPLFDAIESDVTAFFVSQGTVFDSLVKVLMDRMTAVESRVELLRSNVTHNFNLVNQRIDANCVAAAEVTAATAAAAAAAALAAFPVPVVEYTSSSPAAVATIVDPGGRNDELEYYVMTLSRQLNMVLEVLFQPHGGSNVVEVVQAKQTQLCSISDVLTENEAILMQLAAQHEGHHTDAENSEETRAGVLITPSRVQEAEPVVVLPDSSQESSTRKTTSSGPVSSEPPKEVSSTEERNNPQQAQAPMKSQPDTSSLPSGATGTASLVVDQQEDLSTAGSQPRRPHGSLGEVVETISPHLDASPLTKKEVVVRTVNSLPDSQSSTSAPDALVGDDDEEEERDQMPAQSSSFRSHLESSLHRKKSFFRNCQDLQREEEDRLREQRRREEELMRRMHELLLHSRSHIQRNDHVEVWQQQQDEATQSQQTMIFHLQGELQEQIRVQQQREQEWVRQHEAQRKSETESIQHDVDRKLETINSLIIAAQTSQGQEIAQVMQLLGDIEKRSVSREAMEATEALWLKTAADNCIYGANQDTLSILLRDLKSFQTKLNSHPVKSTTLSALHEAVDRAVQLLQRPAPSSTNMIKGSEQESSMYTLRQLLAKIDSLYRTAAAEHEEYPLPGIEFLAEMIHRMELGTANLLDAVDFQQENFQQSSILQQSGLEKLQKELWRQQEVENVLRTQLGACPSKEDTMRLVQELHDQIKATSADSASRLLDTVDDLKYRMGGLPNSQMLEQLAIDLYAKTDQISHDLGTTAGKLAHELKQKADRAEIDRLQSLLESGSGNAPPAASLTKSPLRCLSCDQHLPFAQAPHDDSSYPESPTTCTHRPGSPRSPPKCPPRPIVYQNQQQPQHLSPYPSQQQSVHPQQDGVYDDLGINMNLLEELFAASTSALDRRRRQRQHLQQQLFSPQREFDSAWGIRTPAPMFLNIDDGRNRIPLRKTQLSDKVIYGPAITPGAFKKKSTEESRNERPKTAAVLERRPGGDIITRTSSSTVIVRPFAELTEKRLKKR